MDRRIVFFILITFAKDCESVNGTCPADEFQCHNNRCTNLDYVCDGDNDCGDSSDEARCDPCPANFSRCTAGDRPCVPDKYVCDSFRHCKDGSDESTCNPCPANMFRCTSGDRPCVPDRWVCDGGKDCEDGSDESTCKTCKIGGFHCDQSRCIRFTQICNGIKDCGDNSDETNCDTCKADAFHCDKSRCISSTEICDGDKNCGDNSDETNCGRDQTQIIVTISVLAAVVCALIGAVTVYLRRKRHARQETIQQDITSSYVQSNREATGQSAVGNVLEMLQLNSGSDSAD